MFWWKQTGVQLRGVANKRKKKRKELSYIKTQTSRRKVVGAKTTTSGNAVYWDMNPTTTRPSTCFEKSTLSWNFGKLSEFFSEAFWKKKIKVRAIVLMLNHEKGLKMGCLSLSCNAVQNSGSDSVFFSLDLELRIKPSQLASSTLRFMNFGSC